MPNFICTTCATQYVVTEMPPGDCAIRQAVDDFGGTDQPELDQVQEVRLIGIGIVSLIVIGQRALFLRLPKANILWDCL